jgi:hypothetical protein
MKRSLSKGDVNRRRSDHCNGIITNTIGEINMVLEDWEADIFEDYGAITPIESCTMPISPLKALGESSRVVSEEIVKSRAKNPRLSIPATRQTDSEEETPKTHMYNIHKRANGDF